VNEVQVDGGELLAERTIQFCDDLRIALHGENSTRGGENCSQKLSSSADLIPAPAEDAAALKRADSERFSIGAMPSEPLPRKLGRHRQLRCKDGTAAAAGSGKITGRIGIGDGLRAQRVSFPG
jgi:hypothetical protein